MSNYEYQKKRAVLPWQIKDNTQHYSTARQSQTGRAMPDEVKDDQKLEKIIFRRNYQYAQEKSGNSDLNRLISQQTNEACMRAKQLATELKTMHKHEPITLDGEYTARFSVEQSAIACGPRGATSGGLRPLHNIFDLYFGIIDKDQTEKRDMAEKNAKVNEAIRSAGKVKLLSSFQNGSGSTRADHYAAGKIHKIDASMTQLQKQEKLRLQEELQTQRELARKIQQFQKEQRARNPIKKKQIEDQIPPMHGPGFGGWGTI